MPCYICLLLMWAWHFLRDSI